MTELPISRSGVGGFFSPGRRGRRLFLSWQAGSAAFSLLAGGVGGYWWALPGFGLIGGGCNIFSAVIMYNAEKCTFSDGAECQ